MPEKSDLPTAMHKIKDKADTQDRNKSVGTDRPNTDTPQPKPQASFSAYMIKAIVWGVLIWILSQLVGNSNNFCWTVLGVAIYSTPIALSGIYAVTLRKIQQLTFFSSQGIIYFILSRRLLKSVLWIFWALVSSFFMLIHFHIYTWQEWIALSMAIPVFWTLFSFSRKLIRREMKDFLITGMALRSAKYFAPIIMVIIYTGLISFYADYPGHGSIEEAVQVRTEKVAEMTGSALAQETAYWVATYEATETFLIHRVGEKSRLLIIVFKCIVNLAIFFNVSAMLSCFAIPAAEFRRIFGPLTEAPVPPSIAPGRIAMNTAIIVFVLFFIYLPAFVTIETTFQQKPQIHNARKTAEHKFIPMLDKIGSEFFQTGTIDQLTRARLSAEMKFDAAVIRLNNRIDSAFVHMEKNVDAYLDWYYSLPAEYLRIGKMMTGDLEDYMALKLEEFLNKGQPLHQVESELNQAIAGYEAAKQTYRDKAEQVMAQNQVNKSEYSHFEVVSQISPEEALNLSLPADVIGFNARMIAGAGTLAGINGTITALVIKKVLRKAAAKNTLKVAAKAVTKIVASKAAGSTGGAGAGALAGAAIGSSIPAVGTAAGAVVGGIIGAVTAGVTVDKMLLMLESAINRESMKAELVSAIREAKEAFKAEYLRPKTGRGH